MTAPQQFAAFVMLGDVGPFTAGPFPSEETANAWMSDALALADPAGWAEHLDVYGTTAEALSEYQSSLSAMDFAHVYPTLDPAAALRRMKRETAA